MWVQSGRVAKLIARLHLVSILRMREATLPLRVDLQGCTAVTLPLHAVY